ncbi:hypothetical protein DVH24_014026 [Malus domestica]|uniref:CCR4-Not complex component Not1 C-terminal domain-containing protein n=1 Tax=Malus domestica TaxID=3750 RepID=A0A498JD50_MALDO|nr:hypothetical protein DVH24_014026 [Malus domestica]
MWDSTIRYDTENRWCGRSTIDRHRVNAGESSRCTNAPALPAANDDQGISHVLGVSLAQCMCLCCLPSGTGFANFLVPMQLVPICELPCADAACAHFILQLHQSGLLKGDDMTDRFFRVLTELSVAYCLSSEMTIPGSLQTPQQVQNISFLAIDIYAKLVFLILKGSSKLFLLSKILAITVGFIQTDAEEKKTSFNRRSSGPLGSLVPLILTAFANAFHALQPPKVPTFSFAWLELVSHRSFKPKMLAGNGQKVWPYIQGLLVHLFQFMEPFLRNAELGVPVCLFSLLDFIVCSSISSVFFCFLVLLVLLHDFPEFLCDYHFTFCDVIPPSCIQMRNIILNAFPRNMRLPDPSTPNLKIDLLAEISQSPFILSEVDAALIAKQMKADTRQQGSSFLTELKQKLLLLPIEAASAGTHYNVPLINSLVLYVGMLAIQQLQARTPHAQSTQTVPLIVYLVGAALDIFQTLIVDLDTEGRYLFLNAIANQLHYPNTHTHYFFFIVLYLFAESNQEQITRVLLERLIVNQPRLWGLLIIFIELIMVPTLSTSQTSILFALRLLYQSARWQTMQQGSSFLTELKHLPSEVAPAGTRYNVPLINSLVLYVLVLMLDCATTSNCSNALLSSSFRLECPNAQSTQTVPLTVHLVGAALDIFQTLILDLDTEGRYLFVNATANLLRYPNTHTHYVSFIVLYLFAESNQHEIIQEQITRVLLERLIVNHLIHGVFGLPWLSLSRIRCAPEIEKLFGCLKVLRRTKTSGRKYGLKLGIGECPLIICMAKRHDLYF